MRLSGLLIALVMLLGAGSAPAAEARVRLASGIALDDAGRDLRRAITAYETAQRRGLPEAWSLVQLERNRSLRFGDRGLFVLVSVEDDEAMLIVSAGEEGASQAVLRRGLEGDAGPVQVILVSTEKARGRAQVLMRAKEPGPLLVTGPPSWESRVRLTGFENPNEMVIVAPDDRTVRFGRAFLEAYNMGASAEEAARAARENVPPVAEFARAGAAEAGGRAVRPVAEPEDDFDSDWIPQNARITLRSVRGEASALRELSGAVSYDSAGRSPDDVAVGGRAGEAGGTVSVGRPGDRFQAALRALERQGQARVESENFMRVPIGGSSHFSFSGPAGGVGGRFTVIPRGRERVEVLIDQSTGDWGHYGFVQTRAIFRDGQTLPLAQNLSERTTSSRSGAPIFSQIPYVGPLFGSSTETSVSSSYALYATVELE